MLKWSFMLNYQMTVAYSLLKNVKINVAYAK